jgi:hypothetical protein
MTMLVLALLGLSLTERRYIGVMLTCDSKLVKRDRSVLNPQEECKAFIAVYKMAQRTIQHWASRFTRC